MRSRSAGRALGAVLLTSILLATACSSATTSSPDTGSSPSAASATQQASDPVCERFAGIYAAWASTWKRDVDRLLNGGVDLAEAQQRASRSLKEPFRRAVLAEIDRDAQNAVDPVLIEAMSQVSTSPDDQSAYERLAYVCGAVGPVPLAR